MLPTEITAIAPTVVKWDKGSEIMTLPLRDAREVFEREYLLAQVTRFGGNISRTAAFVGMERSALHRKLKSLGVFNGDRPLEARRLTAPPMPIAERELIDPMSRIAYVNGRYLPHRDARGAYRGSRLPVRRRRL